MTENICKSKIKIPYGCDKLGKLKCVMLHRPGKALELINESNYRQMLFDKVPNISAYIDDHDLYRQLLEDNGIEVLELKDFVYKNRDLIDSMANLTFLHDIAVISDRGAILSKMAFESRQNEHIVVKEALENMDIPVLMEFTDLDDFFEGCLLVTRDLIIVAQTERHSRRAVVKFMARMRKYFKEIVYVDVPKQRRFMHPDTIFNRVTDNLAIAYLPAFIKTYLISSESVEMVDFSDFLEKRGMEIINIADEEQRKLGCSFVPLDNGVMLHYDNALNKSTQRLLASKGIELVLFHPRSLNEGGGSLRCHTLRIKRQ